MRPVEEKTTPNWELLLECLLLSYCLLLVDIFLPLGIAGGVLHIIVVLLALRSSDLRYPIGFAILGSVLTLVGLLLSEPMGIPWMVYTNRGIALLAIWATTLLGLRLKHYQAKLSDGLYHWGDLNRQVKAGFSAEVSFKPDGAEPRVEVRFQIDRKMLILPKVAPMRPKNTN